MELYDDRHAKRKAPWGTGPSCRVNILGGTVRFDNFAIGQSFQNRPTRGLVRRGRKHDAKRAVPRRNSSGRKTFGPPDI